MCLEQSIRALARRSITLLFSKNLSRYSRLHKNGLHALFLTHYGKHHIKSTTCRLPLRAGRAQCLCRHRSAHVTQSIRHLTRPRSSLTRMASLAKRHHLPCPNALPIKYPPPLIPTYARGRGRKLPRPYKRYLRARLFSLRSLRSPSSSPSSCLGSMDTRAYSTRLSSMRSTFTCSPHTSISGCSPSRGTTVS